MRIHFPPSPSLAAVVLNGQRQPLTFSVDEWRHYQQVVVTDGAWDDFRSTAVAQQCSAQTVVLGDGDSLHDKPPAFIYKSCQQTTDFDKALQYLIEQGIGAADVFWADGGDVDHYLGNLSTAKHYQKQITLRFFNQHQCYFLLSSEQPSQLILTGARSHTISLYPFPQAQVSSQGLAYPLEKMTLNLDKQQSLRNYATADAVKLNWQGDVWVIIRLPARQTIQ